MGRGADSTLTAAPARASGPGEIEYFVCPECGLGFNQALNDAQNGECRGQLPYESWRPEDDHEPVKLERREVPDFAGRRVRLAKGAKVIRDLHPQSEAPIELSRSQIVRVNHTSNERGVPTIVWAGSGGYWRAAYAHDAVLAED